MNRTAIVILAASVALGAVAPGLAQRIELKGSSSNGLDIGPVDVEIDRAMEGEVAVEVGEEGVDLDARGSTRVGVNGRGIEIGSGPGGEADRSAGGGEAVSAEPEATELHSPMSQMRLPSEIADGDCPDVDRFAQHRDAFIVTPVPEASVYIRRVDVTVCGYEPSRELMTYLNTMPEIRDGLEQMLIDPEHIVSADWTDDAGLLIYTVEP